MVSFVEFVGIDPSKLNKNMYGGQILIKGEKL